MRRAVVATGLVLAGLMLAGCSASGTAPGGAQMAAAQTASAAQQMNAVSAPALVGTWNLADDSLRECTVYLQAAIADQASQRRLASTADCAEGMGTVRAWQLVGQDMYLFDASGGVLASLSPDEDGIYRGPFELQAGVVLPARFERIGQGV